jgi:hypothetical protein
MMLMFSNSSIRPYSLAFAVTTKKLGLRVYGGSVDMRPIPVNLKFKKFRCRRSGRCSGDGAGTVPGCDSGNGGAGLDRREAQRFAEFQIGDFRFQKRLNCHAVQPCEFVAGKRTRT